MCEIIRVVVVFPFEPVTATIGMRDGDALREQQVDDRLRHVLWLALGGVRVHSEPRRRVHLDHGAAALTDGLRDVGSDEVDAGHVEADHLRGLFGDLDVLLVRFERPVDGDAPRGHVPRLGELHHGVLRRNVLQLESLGSNERRRLVVDLDAGQDLFVPDAAPRVEVGRLDELGDCVLAVADDVGGNAFSDGDHPSADDQDPVIVPRHVGLDHDAAASRFRAGALVPLSYRVVVAQFEADAPAVVPVERFRDDRVPDPTRPLDGLVRRANDLAARHGQPCGGQQARRELLVTGDVDGQCRRAGRHGRADAALELALPELDQRLLVQSDPGDVAAHRLVDERLGGGPERPLLRKTDQVLQGDQEVESLLRLDQVVDQPGGELPRLESHLLLAVVVDDVVLTGGAGGACLAAAGRRAGLALQFDRDVLGDMAEPRAFLQPLQQAAGLAQ